jgi:cytochrome b subunit of formate dehydrogenase
LVLFLLALRLFRLRQVRRQLARVQQYSAGARLLIKQSSASRLFLYALTGAAAGSIPLLTGIKLTDLYKSSLGFVPSVSILRIKVYLPAVAAVLLFFAGSAAYLYAAKLWAGYLIRGNMQGN